MPQLTIEADSIAQHFVAARRAAMALPDYPGVVPTTLAAAYAVQDAAIGQFGASVVGWKVGRIFPPRSDELGTQRLAGPIFAGSLVYVCDDAAPVGRIFSGGFGAAEAELLFRIGTAPPPGQTRFTLEEADALVDAVFVGMEIASSPFPGINALGPLVTISDFGNNNGLIVGAAIDGWRDADVANLPVTLRVNGAVLGQGRAAAFPDGPLGSVRFLLENLASRNIAVSPGTLVSTGAITGVHEVKAGQHIEAHFGADYRLNCTIDHAVAH